MKSKYKKILLSVLSICLVAVFLFVIPSEFYAGERAEEGESFYTSVTFNFNATLDYEKTNVMLSPISEQIITSNGTTTMTSFYYYSGAQHILTTSNEVYAYKISIAAPTGSFSSNNKQVLEQRYCFGSDDELQKVNVTYGNAPSSSNSSSVWYVNNYQNINLYMAVMSNVYSLYNGSTVSHPNVGISTTVVLTVTPYTIEDLTEDIYEQLLISNQNDTNIIQKLESIYNSSSSTNTKLQQLYNIASDLNTNTIGVKNLLAISNIYLQNIQDESYKQTTWLQRIWESLQRLINPNDDENDNIDEFGSESDRVDSELDDVLNDMDSVPKPDVDDYDGFLGDLEYIGSYAPTTGAGYCLLLISSNPVSYNFLILVGILALVAYLFFGKR